MQLTKEGHEEDALNHHDIGGALIEFAHSLTADGLPVTKREFRAASRKLEEEHFKGPAYSIPERVLIRKPAREGARDMFIKSAKEQKTRFGLLTGMWERERLVISGFEDATLLYLEESGHDKMTLSTKTVNRLSRELRKAHYSITPSGKKIRFKGPRTVGYCHTYLGKQLPTVPPIQCLEECPAGVEGILYLAKRGRTVIGLDLYHCAETIGNSMKVYSGIMSKSVPRSTARRIFPKEPLSM